MAGLGWAMAGLWLGYGWVGLGNGWFGLGYGLAMAGLIFFLWSYFSICNPVIFLWLYLLLLQSCLLSYSCISFIGGLVLFLTAIFPLSAVLSSFLTAVSSYVLFFFFLWLYLSICSCLFFFLMNPLTERCGIRFV